MKKSKKNRANKNKWKCEIKIHGSKRKRGIERERTKSNYKYWIGDCLNWWERMKRYWGSWGTHPTNMIIENTAPTLHTNNIELHSYFITGRRRARNATNLHSPTAPKIDRIRWRCGARNWRPIYVYCVYNGNVFDLWPLLFAIFYLIPSLIIDIYGHIMLSLYPVHFRPDTGTVWLTNLPYILPMSLNAATTLIPLWKFYSRVLN